MPVTTKDANELFHALIRIQKLLLAARQAAPTVHSGVDAVAYPVMFAVHRAEPVGISDVAGMLHCDVSTVSRQVSGLVAQGLLGKEPDPNDGRAALVSTTEEGQHALDVVQARRGAWFQGLLEHWDAEETATFITSLHRLAESLEQNLRDRGAAAPVNLSASDRTSRKENPRG